MIRTVDVHSFSRIIQRLVHCDGCSLTKDSISQTSKSVSCNLVVKHPVKLASQRPTAYQRAKLWFVPVHDAWTFLFPLCKTSCSLMWLSTCPLHKRFDSFQHSTFCYRISLRVSNTLPSNSIEVFFRLIKMWPRTRKLFLR